MTRRLERNFSHHFNGTIWNTALAPSNATLVLEVRNAGARQTSFSALRLDTGQLLWKDVTFEEPWWVSLNAAQDDIALFTVYTETDNPDKKALFAFHIHDRKILWWNNDFSLAAVGIHSIAGVSAKYGNRALALDLMSGAETTFVPQATGASPVLRPTQFTDGHAYFATVRTFLVSRFNLTPIIALEYMEHAPFILISCYVLAEGLVNYLLILSANGELLLQEKLGEQLKGIGQDTFFVYDRSVIFVKNRGELFSYKLV